MRFLLLHSPLVGPATWRWVAGALRSAGHEVDVPDLRPAVATGDPLAVVAAAVAGAGAGAGALGGEGEVVVVGHSGAGFFVPPVAVALGPAARGLVFVDAGVPPCDGAHTASADFLDRLRAMAVGGVLPRWSTWWGDGVMEALVPDAGRRAAVEAELPEVPLALYESPVSMPAGWCSLPGGYVLLSDAYVPDAERARSLGWPVDERLGNHLDVVNDPDGAAGAVAAVGVVR